MSLDLEMNQPSGTIIQVGIAVGNLESGEIIESICWDIKTQEQISKFIQDLTGITQGAVENGEELYYVYQVLKNRHLMYGCFRNCLTWGGGDSETLRTQLGLDDEAFLFGRRWIDAKTLFISRCFSLGLKHQSGLAKAMSRLGLQFKGRKHNAMDDAINTFYIYHKLIQDFK
jgi:inhibitor of KinA sporulation pathway (predicted exonuclease)